MNDATFLGGITNSSTGTISSVADYGIRISNVAVFGSSSAGGGITNAGLISSPFAIDIVVHSVTTFVGDITNSGTISGGGVVITAVSTFAAGIVNSGLIAAAGGWGIKVTGSGTVGLNSAGGGIVNSGTIIGTYGILVGNVTALQGGITNTQKITGAIDSILISSTGSVSGAIVNSAGATISGENFGIDIAINSVANFSSTSAGGGITNAGTISGATGIKISGNVVFAAGTAIVNTGNITGTGGTAITAAADASSVVIDQNAGKITGNVLLSSHADVMTIAGGTVVGNITGAGSSDTLNFSLASSATYTDSNNFTGLNQVNITSGTVLLDGTDSATNIDVLSGATLGGTGTLNPDLTIHGGGTFAPGVPGTFMQVTGSLTLQSAAIYMITINGANTSGANVTGTAAIQTGALAEGNPASSNAIIGNTYTIMTATTVTGVFADPKFFFGRYEGVLSYGSDDVLLTVENGALTPLLPPNPPQNVLNVANAIDNAIQSGVNPPANFTNLFNYTPAQLENALAALEGQPATGVQTSAFQLMTDFMNLLSDPSSGGGGSPTGGATGFAPEQEASLPSDIAEAYAAIRCCAAAWPGRTTGSQVLRSAPCSRRCRDRTSPSTAPRRRPTPRSPAPAPSCTSPPTGRRSPNSTASSPRPRRLMPAQER